MPKASINVEIDADIKELATRLLERMGLDQTTAIDIFFRQIIAERRLPFQPVVNPTLDEMIAGAALARAAKSVKLKADEHGNILLEEGLHPDIYDWAENG